MLALEVSNLNFSYEDKRVLEDVTFDVREGEILTVIGPNGAGKTTLFLNLTGVLKGEGVIRLFGRSIDDFDRRELVETIGMVFQNPDDQLFMPTVFDDLSFGLINLGLDKDEIVDRVNWVLSKFRLEEIRDQYPHHLSFGEKKKVAIASVVCMKPRILLLDEPTANLDPISRRDLIETILKLVDEGMTIVIATHDVDLALYSNRVMILNGRVIDIGEPDEILSDLDKLRRNGLDAPQIVKLFLSLGLQAPRSFDDAVKILKRYLS